MQRLLFGYSLNTSLCLGNISNLPCASSFLDLLLGCDDDGVALHLDVQLFGLVLVAVQADLELVLVVVHLGMRLLVLIVCLGCVHFTTWRGLLQNKLDISPKFLFKIKVLTSIHLREYSKLASTMTQAGGERFTLL